jgi:hypothetical protein
MSRTPRCTFCDLPLEAGVERCPRCLRKSSVRDPVQRVRTAAPGLEIEGAEAAGPAHVGVRALITTLAYVVYLPLTYVIISSKDWLDPHRLWLAACFGAMALGTMPLRMGFAPPDAPMDARGAAEHYALRMLAVLGIAAGLFTAQALAAQLVSEDMVALFLGLLFFLAPLLVIPALIKARREGSSAQATLASVGKGLGLAAAIVVAVGALAALRASSHPPPKTIVIPADPGALLDPLDLASVQVSSRWVADEAGRGALELSADGGAFERSMMALVGNVTGKLGELKHDPRASGAVRLVLPARFDTKENRKAADDEATMLTGALEGSRTVSGDPLRVSFVFGEVKGR